MNHLQCCVRFAWPLGFELSTSCTQGMHVNCSTIKVLCCLSTMMQKWAPQIHYTLRHNTSSTIKGLILVFVFNLRSSWWEKSPANKRRLLIDDFPLIFFHFFFPFPILFLTQVSLPYIKCLLMFHSLTWLTKKIA